MSSRPICIVGTGVAALALMQELRHRDAHVPITAIAVDEGHYSYLAKLDARAEQVQRLESDYQRKHGWAVTGCNRPRGNI